LGAAFCRRRAVAAVTRFLAAYKTRWGPVPVILFVPSLREARTFIKVLEQVEGTRP
jgi:hypothetical protein